ncbi:class I SAM-dependent methyltransferase [Pyrodictium occultum]|uniref:class I SAM-dependent methyltransferase n=1 Tax=Pyrodictium occultum TaxID=2309 RepID=UPI0009FA9716|nr:class I SAM-dependent methyltransferase [Pyrodictium occultum]
MSQMNPKVSAINSILSRLRLARDSKLLDIGCGDGSLTILIANKLKVSEIYCIDVDENALSIANKKGIITFKLDISRDDLPFPENTFDLCLMLDVIEHLENPDHALREAYRVLKRGGYLLITTPNMASWYNRLLLLLGKPILGIDLSKEFRYRYPLGVTQVISGHLRLYTLDALRKMLFYHGFRVKYEAGYPQVFSKTQVKGFIRLVRLLDASIARISKTWAANLLVLAVKS